MSFYSCGNRISTWLLVHFFFTWYISIFYIIPLVSFAVFIGRVIWVVKRIGSGNFDIEYVINDRGYSRLFNIRCRQIMKLIFPELMRILLYASVALFCRLIMNNN